MLDLGVSCNIKSTLLAFVKLDIIKLLSLYILLVDLLIAPLAGVQAGNTLSERESDFSRWAAEIIILITNNDML